MIAVDRYVAICHPLRYSQLATAARARALVVLLASLTLVLGLLGAAGFSVYHSLPVTSTAATPHSPPTHVVTSTSSVDAERDACTPAINQTVCSTTSYALVNTGLCGRSDLLLSAGFLRGYLVVHSLIYPLCLLAVLVLYSLIYRAVLVRRARRLRMRGAGPAAAIALAERPTPAAAAASLLPTNLSAAAGTH